MSTLELIDFSFEDDSLLPPTISPPEDKPLECVLRLSLSRQNEKKTPWPAGGVQTPSSAGRQEAADHISFSSPGPPSGNDAVQSGPASSLDANARSGSRLTKSEARSKTLTFFKHFKGNMAKSEGKPTAKAVLTSSRARAISWNDSMSKSGEKLHLEEAERPQNKEDQKPIDGQDGQSKDLQQRPRAQPADPTPPEMAARKTRSARAMHSLRKSLAWDKAFLTDEGILDGDELPLATKTPKKLADLPPLDLPDIMAIVSRSTKSEAVSSVETSNATVGGDSVLTQKPSSGTPEHAPNQNINVSKTTVDNDIVEKVTNNENFSAVEGARHSRSQSLSSTITSPPTSLTAVSGFPRPVPLSQVIEAAAEKGTKLRLPNTLANMHHEQLRINSFRKLEKGSEDFSRIEYNTKPQTNLETVTKLQKDMEPAVIARPQTYTLTRCRSTSSLIKPPPTSTSLSKKVSSVSKKVKDTLGRVLPGSMGGRSSTSRKIIAETAHADRLRPAASIPQLPSSSSTGSGMKVPGSPGPSYLTRSKSARAAPNGGSMGESNSNAPKTGVLAEMSNRGSNAISAKPPSGQKKSKGESIWGSLRGRGGSSSAKGNENVPINSNTSSPGAIKKTAGLVTEIITSQVHNPEESFSTSSAENSSQSSIRSGLRKPSPKMGFFDAGRPVAAPEKPLAAAVDVLTRHGLPPRPPSQHGSTSARFAQLSSVDPLVAAVRGYVSSGIPTAPTVTRTSGKARKKGLVSSASAPASPRKNSELLSPGTHRAVTGRYLTSRSDSTRIQIEASPEPRRDTPGAVRKLTLGGNAEDSMQSSRVAEAAIKLSFSEDDGCEEVQINDSVPDFRTPSKLPTSVVDSCADVASGATMPGQSELQTGDRCVNNIAVSSEEPRNIQHMPSKSRPALVNHPSNDELRVNSAISQPEMIIGDSAPNSSGTLSVLSISEQSSSERETSPTSPVDVVDRVFVGSPTGLSKDESINLVNSLSCSPDIKSTFWELQDSSAQVSANPTFKESETAPSANLGTSHRLDVLQKHVGSEDPAGARAESKIEILDQVSGLTTAEKHHSNFKAEHESSSLQADHGRRKSIFGWQEMHAALSSPSDAADSGGQCMKSQQSDMSDVCSTHETSKSRASFDLSTTILSPLVEKSLDDDFRAEQTDNLKKQEPGQIMTGANVAELRGEVSTHENAWNSSTQCEPSVEEMEDKSDLAPAESREKQILQSKLEDFFDSPSHWSGWPILEVAPQSSSRRGSVARGASLLSGTPDSRGGSNGAEKFHDGNLESFRKSVSPMADADFCNENRDALANVSRGLLNVSATESSRLSITPPLKKERGLLAFARSAVSRLTSSGGSSPRHEGSRAIDRDGPGSGSFRKSRRFKSSSSTKPADVFEGNDNAQSQSPFSEERIRALEAAVQEAILMKSTGAVQHSPPNKPQQPPNPWSPVKRPGQQLGPFDCTKKTVSTTSVV